MRAAKSAALEAQDFWRAAMLRDVERKLERLGVEFAAAAEGAEFPLPKGARSGWEFHVVDLGGDAAAWATTLNKLGAEGWELAWMGENPPRAAFERKVGQ